MVKIKSEIEIENRRKICKAARKWRIEHGYQQADIVRELGVSRSLVCNFERGEHLSGYVLAYYCSIGFQIRDAGVTAWH